MCSKPSRRTLQQSTPCRLDLAALREMFCVIVVDFHFHAQGKTVAENLKMSSALLSRFDLVFILLDQVSIVCRLRAEASCATVGCSHAGG